MYAHALRWLALCWGLTAALFGPAPSARAGEGYYLLIFGAQRAPTEPRYTHSFAVFVKATGPGPGGEGGCLETVVISWMPQTLDIRVRLLIPPEPGVKLSLEDTFAWLYSEGMRASVWGPYRVQREVYERAARHEALLQSGAVRYKAVDTGHHPNSASNCIHAISTIESGYRLRVLSPSWGETASFYITHRYRRWICDRRHDHEWVYTALGLDAYPLIRRGWWEHPRSGVFWGLIKTALGIRDPYGAP